MARGSDGSGGIQTNRKLRKAWRLCDGRRCDSAPGLRAIQWGNGEAIQPGGSVRSSGGTGLRRPVSQPLGMQKKRAKRGCSATFAKAIQPGGSVRLPVGEGTGLRRPVSQPLACAVALSSDGRSIRPHPRLCCVGAGISRRAARAAVCDCQWQGNAIACALALVTH